MNMLCYFRPSLRSFSRLSTVIGQALLSLLLIHAGGLAKAADFTVRTINDEYAYTINGVVGSPRLTLIRGQTYTFDVSTCSCHPFVINDYLGNQLAGSFITNNNTNSGTIVFTVPLTTSPPQAATYPYRCTLHTFGNTILTLASLPPPPLCSTLAASNVAVDGASLGTSVKGNGAVTSYNFIYGTDPALATGTTTSPGQGVLALNTLQTFSANFTGLQPATTYYYRAQANNIAGTTQGSILSFTTLSNNANLSGLTLSTGTLSPVFASGTTSYSASVFNATGSITLTPTVADSNATVVVNDVPVTSGSPSADISLTLGSNVITTVVTAQDGSTTQSYTVTVTRQSLLEDWRQTWFGTTSNTGNAADTADPEHDGIPNYLEFATNSNPNTWSPRTGKAVVNGSNIEFTYTRSKAAMAYGVTFTVEWSDTMLAGSWTSAATSETILSEDTTVQNVKTTLPAGTSGHRFVHLAVAGP